MNKKQKKVLKYEKVGKSTIEMLEKAGCLEGMSQSNQMSLFA